jgi:carboxypeptidase family protein/TonB-dependent receptor-like protein
MAKVIRVLLVSLLFSVCFVSRIQAQAQATTGVIEGQVVDPGGGTLPGASVTIRNTATGFEQTLRTDNQGRFRAVQLPLGPYRVTVALPGFSTLVRDGLRLEVGATITLPLKLEISTVQQEVNVTAQAPVVEQSRTAGATYIEEKAVNNLPNLQHNFIDFTKLTPGVSTVQSPDGEQLIVNGQKGIQNNVSVDGADFNNPFFGEYRGGQRPAFTFNLDAIQEVVVVADGANAEFGRSSSGFVNVVTKSGTNDFHGSGHFYYKDNNFAARPLDDHGNAKDEFDFDQEQLGATLGGPIQKDKLFFFLAFDGQRARSTKQVDPARIEQRVVDAFAKLGSPNENDSIDRTNDARVFLAKFDWQASSQHLVTGRYNYTWADQNNGTFDVDSWGTSANADEKDYSNAGTLNVLSTFSAAVSNELRLQWAREERPRPYNGPIITDGNGIQRPLPDTAFDFVKGYRFGMPFFIPVDYHDTRVQVVDNVSYIYGNHYFKAGVEYNDVASSQTFRGFGNGLWKFASTDAFFDFLAHPDHKQDVLLYIQQAGVGGLTVDEAGTQKITQREPAVFIQDLWQPMPNLTFQFGLRWEAQIEPDPITPPDQVFFAPFIGKTVKGQTFPSDGTIPSDWKLWQPRVGFSWDPWKDGKSVFRGNAGLFYARIPGLVLASTRSTNGSLGQSLGTIPSAYPNLLTPAQTGGTPDHPGVFVTDSDFQNPRTFAWSASAEREVLTGLALLVKYNYAKTTHLTRFVDRNAVELGSPWSTGLAPGGTNGVSSLTTVESTASSKYWGWTFGVSKRFTDRVGFQVNYTYSKDKSDDDNERDPFTLRYAKIHEDPSDPASEFSKEWGYSDRDQRHRINSYLLWIAPGELACNFRYSYRSHQPQDVNAAGVPTTTPQDRINPDGTVTRRNLGFKDNQFSSLDLRLSRPFDIGSGVIIEPSVEGFNLFNSKNTKKPAVTNLVFNFDGTVQEGSGDPRQFQFGVRVTF